MGHRTEWTEICLRPSGTEPQSSYDSRFNHAMSESGTDHLLYDHGTEPPLRNKSRHNGAISESGTGCLFYVYPSTA